VVEDTLTVEPIRQWWASLDGDWQGVCVGFLLLAVVSMGFPIPW
jgi:hypothetical protein